MIFDEDIWRTTKEGHHILIEEGSGTVKAGMGGKFNGQKIDEIGKSSGSSKSVSPSKSPEKEYRKQKIAEARKPQNLPKEYSDRPFADESRSELAERAGASIEDDNLKYDGSDAKKGDRFALSHPVDANTAKGKKEVASIRAKYMEKMQKSLTEAGYNAELKKQSDGRPYIQLTTSDGENAGRLDLSQKKNSYGYVEGFYLDGTAIERPNGNGVTTRRTGSNPGWVSQEEK